MNPIGHFKTITEHKLLVMKHCFKIGLYRQGLTHDLSKYSPWEFLIGAKYYQGTRSPNNAEREAKGYSAAWLHHTMDGMKMPRKYVAEMLADRIAASKVYNKGHYTQHDPLDYFLKGKAHYMMHPQTARELEYLLRYLDRYGEEACFQYVRNVYLKKKTPRRFRKKAVWQISVIRGYDQKSLR